MERGTLRAGVLGQHLSLRATQSYRSRQFQVSSGDSPVHPCSTECDSPSMMSLLAELDRSNVVDVDLGSAEFKANAHRHMAEWARRRPFYVLGNGPPQCRPLARPAPTCSSGISTVAPGESSVMP